MMGIKIGQIIGKDTRKGMKSIARNNDAAKKAAIVGIVGNDYVVELSRLPMGSFSIVDGLMVVGEESVGVVINAWEARVHKGSYDLLWA